MGVNLKFGTAGATGGGWSSQPGTLQPAFTEARHEPRFSWQARGPKTWRDPYRWVSLWSFGCKTQGAIDGDYNVTMALGHGYEPFSCDGPGSKTLKFLKGVCRDVSNNALSGVVVQAFRTSDDAFAGYEVQTRSDGSYDLPTNFPGVAHYAVAYLAGSPDRAGTTVNTLIPTNVDGT